MTATVTNTAGACADPAMPFMWLAVDPVYMEPRLRSAAGAGAAELQAIRIARWKPGRRCVLEYELADSQSAGRRRTLVGKVRAKSLDIRTYRLARQLAIDGLAPDDADGISVPPALGAVPECHMWLQEKVSGTPAWHALADPGGARAARRIGRALAKLQRVLPPLARRHSMLDEMAHLRVTLDRVAAQRPGWARRLRKVQRACERLVAGAEQAASSGVHRDFYHDQVLVDADRIWLLDLDLAAEADPAVDVGNFTAHLAEQSLRLLGNPDTRVAEEAEFVAGYFDGGGRARPGTIEIYKTLSLVRHIYLATTIEGRRPYTGALLTLCEHRLQL